MILVQTLVVHTDSSTFNLYLISQYANIATNFLILDASTICLGALATILGAISCREHPRSINECYATVVCVKRNGTVF